MSYVDRPQPDTGLSGKFSLQYTLASALLDGKVGIGTFTDARLHAPDMQVLLRKIAVRLDPAIPARFETMHVLLSVELANGQVLETRCDGPRGMWGQPPIAEADHLVKVRDCLSVQLTRDDVERCIELASSIETLTAPQVGELMSLVGTRNA